MQRSILLIAFISATNYLFSQKYETVYLNAKDSSSNMYIAVIPTGSIKAYMFLLDGFGCSPTDVLLQTDLSQYAANQGILTILPILKTGPLYFGVDSASQQSLKFQIESGAEKYKLENKNFYIGGFSIGGSAVVKYSELAIKYNYKIKPKALFAVDPPLDWERFYNSALRVIRLSDPFKINQEVIYMRDRIKTEMKVTPQTALQNYYNISPYSFSDTTQSAIKYLIKTPVMFITEPDIQWWLNERGYDLSYLNITDQVSMINELNKLGNKKAVLITAADKGYRKPNNVRHPHSWSIVNSPELIQWLSSQ